MPKKKIISMLEFLRTGVLGGIACGCTTTEVLRQLGKPDYKAISPVDKNWAWFRYDSLEIWFHEETQIVSRMTLQRFWATHRKNGIYQSKGLRKRTHFFEQSVPGITGATVDPWVLREGLDVYTLMRFLKTANINFRHSQKTWARTDQLNLDSEVNILFESANEVNPGLCFIEIEVNSDLLKYPLNESIEISS